MDHEQEVIHKQMEVTRSDLTDKLAALENQVGGSVQAATKAVETTSDAVTGTVEAVTGTVEAVKDTVESVTEKFQETVAGVTDTVQQAVEGVKDSLSETVKCFSETFNLRCQCERRPWTVFGGAVLVGWLGSSLLGSGRQRRSDDDAAPKFKSREKTTPSPSERTASAASSEQLNGGTAGGWLQSKLGSLSGLALGAMMGVVRDMVTQAVPESLKERVSEEINKLTQSFGGEPVQGSILPHADENSATSKDQGNAQQEQNKTSGSGQSQLKGRQTIMTGNGR